MIKSSNKLDDQCELGNCKYMEKTSKINKKIGEKMRSNKPVQHDALFEEMDCILHEWLSLMLAKQIVKEKWFDFIHCDDNYDYDA